MDLMSQAIQELIYFENLKKCIIDKIIQDWNSKECIHEKIKNKYYDFEYMIEDCYNETGYRNLKFLHTGKTLNDCKFNDIKKWLRYTL